MWSHSIPPVGSGDVDLAVAARRGIEPGEVARALHRALEAGLLLVDVSADDDAQQLVGDSVRALRLRDTALSAFRIPAIAERFGIPTRDVLPERLPARYVQDRVESALRKSRLDALPLVQLGVRAFWRSSSAWPEIVDTCARLVREGKVLEWAALVDTIEDDTPDLLHERWLVALNVPYSLCERTADAVLAATAARVDPTSGVAHPHRVAVFARRPLAGATLVGTLGPGAAFRVRDDRLGLDEQTLIRVAVGVAKLAAHVKREPPAARSCAPAKQQLDQHELERRRTGIAPERHCDTLAELALRFVISRGAIALPRLHRHEHVAAALVAAHSSPLPVDLVETLARLDI